MTLPTPDPAFHWTDEHWGAALRCTPLATAAQHVFTSKQLGLPRPDGWGDAAASVGADVSHLMRVKQVHGNAVRLLKRGEMLADAAEQRPDGDAIVSNVEGLALAVLVADCVPILVADPRCGAAAAIHAGWRGTCARVVPAAIAMMQREFGSSPADLIAAIGPSVGPGDYEVGESLIEAFRREGHPESSIATWFIPTATKPHLDLWAANRDQLLMAGVTADRIHLCGLSTVSHPDILESYRVEGERAGRMAALIVVPPSA